MRRVWLSVGEKVAGELERECVVSGFVWWRERETVLVPGFGEESWDEVGGGSGMKVAASPTMTPFSDLQR